MAKAAAKTGLNPTALSAMEQCYPENERILKDDMAYSMLPKGQFFVRLMRHAGIRNWMVNMSEKTSPGAWAGLLCRKRYIDEKMLESAGYAEAIVNLGAGFDTRVYRFKEIADIPVWEMDQPENIEAKRKQLLKVLGDIPPHIKLVPIDFDREDPKAVLKSQGYSLDKKTFFIWEAVTQYLTEKGIRSTFGFLSKAAPGSRIAFTYVRKAFLEGKDTYGWERGYKDFVRKKLWLFGMEPQHWPGFLNVYGWKVIEDVGYEELGERYVKPTGRTLAATPLERIVYAEKI